MPRLTLQASDGTPAATLDRFDASDVETALALRPTDPLRAPPDRMGLVAALTAVVAEASSRSHRIVTARVLQHAEGLDEAHLSPWTAAVQGALARVAFLQTGERYDVTADLAACADWIAHHDRGLTWTSLSLHDEDELVRAAAAMQRVSRGDPESNDDEEALPTLRAMRDDDEYPREATRVAVGSVEGDDVAFAFVQRHGPTGIGRVTYVGVVPEVRGRGLGRAAYAHALAMLREVQPARYVGGTSSENRAMCALFDALGARRTRVWRVWRRGL